MIDLSPKPIPRVTREDVERAHAKRAAEARERRIEAHRRADERDRLLVALIAAQVAFRESLRTQGYRGEVPPLVIGEPPADDTDPFDFTDAPSKVIP